MGSFAHACGALGVMPAQVQLYCSSQHAALAQEIQERYHPQSIVFLPPEFLKTQDTWGVRHGAKFWWTPGQ